MARLIIGGETHDKRELREALFSGRLRWLFTLCTIAGGGLATFEKAETPLFWFAIFVTPVYFGLALQNWLKVCKGKVS